MSKKFSSASTVIGFTRIVRAETKPMKICWSVMTLISFAFGLYMTYGTIRDYLEHDVFTQTKFISSSSFPMPSVTFCFREPNTTELNFFFQKAIFKFLNGSVTNLTGEQFSNENLDSNILENCIKFNHFANKSDSQLFSLGIKNDYILFEIDLNFKFKKMHVFLSDNYNNILEWSQFVTTTYNSESYYDIALRKEVEHKLEEPYNQCKNVSDITYRQANCLAQCKNRNFVRARNCTLRNYYSYSGHGVCNEGISSSLEFDSVCDRECPKECTTTKFNILLNKYDLKLASNSTNKLVFYIWCLDASFIEIVRV